MLLIQGTKVSSVVGDLFEQIYVGFFGNLESWDLDSFDCFFVSFYFLFYDII